MSHPVLQRLVPHLREVIWSDVATSTRRAYLGAYSRWQGWALDLGLPCFPVQPVHLALYVVSLVQRQISNGPITQCVAALGWLHRKGCYPDPTIHPTVKQVLEGAKRICARPVNRRAPLSQEQFQQLMCTLCRPTSPLADLQCAALISLGFTALLRWDELHRLCADDVQFCATHMSICLHSRKNDQLRQGDNVLVARCSSPSSVCPVSVVQRFVTAASHKPSQKLFGCLTSARSGPGVRGSMSYSRAKELLHQALVRIGVDPRGYGTHSLRSGGATAAANAGITERLLQRHGGWRSVSSKDKYVLDSKEAMLSVSKAIIG